MKKLFHDKAFLIPIIFFVVLVQIAIHKAPLQYSRLTHSFSVLGGQDMEYGWLMNVAWIGFGTLIVLVSTVYHYKNDLPIAITYPMIAFGIALILCGVWQSGNFLLANDSINEEAKDHELFYMIALGSITLCTIIHAFLSKDKTLKWIHFINAILLFMLMLLMNLIPSYIGLWDHLMWTIILLWLLMLFGRVNAHVNNKRL